MKHDISQVAKAFEMRADFVSSESYGSGHINDTYVARYSRDGEHVRYIHQRINPSIFKDPVGLMTNIERVTRHLQDKLRSAGVSDNDRRALTLVPTVEGNTWHVDGDGNYWRTYMFIEGALTYDQIETVSQAEEAARAFGGFIKDLADLPGGPLTETIPDFHNTRMRFNALQEAISADVCDRAKSVKDEIRFACDRESIVDVLLGLMSKGEIPEVTTHNDTKLNNVMLDDVTGEGICVIDLDTVMPGSSLYDFGDMARSATRPTAEDETDLSKVRVRMDMFEAIVRGFLSSAGDALNQAERDHMPFAARLITFEIGLRFLTDYLQGDVYFKTHREGHNLDRCRTQFKMVASFEEHEDEMTQVVRGTG